MNHPGSASLAPPVSSADETAPLRERAAATPRLACEALARAINAHDLEGALQCFAPGATLVGPNGKASSGEASIRTRLSELIAGDAHVEIELRGVLVAGDLALAHECWQVSYGGVPDSTLPHASCPSLVMRQLEGEWKLAIAAPWGQPASEPLQAVWP
jgi:uncharacterized protein (TIGR02246 family)